MRQFFGFDSTAQSVPAGFDGMQPCGKVSVGTSVKCLRKELLFVE